MGDFWAAYVADMTPEDKEHVMLEFKAAGPTVRVGEGVNDAAALLAANVGIAVSGGSEPSLQASDV